RTDRPSPRADVAARQAGGPQGRRARGVRPQRDHPRAGACGGRMKTPFAALLAQSELDARAQGALRHLRPEFMVPLAVVAVLSGLWLAAAPLAGAIVAPAQIKVELNRKTVQHQEGGIVREILVRDGQKVRAGDPLVVVGDLRSSAELSMLQDRLQAELARQARAAAEAALQPRFVAPAGAGEHAAREQALFAARR